MFSGAAGAMRLLMGSLRCWWSCRLGLRKSGDRQGFDLVRLEAAGSGDSRPPCGVRRAECFSGERLAFVPMQAESDERFA